MSRLRSESGAEQGPFTLCFCEIVHDAHHHAPVIYEMKTRAQTQKKDGLGHVERRVGGTHGQYGHAVHVVRYAVAEMSTSARERVDAPLWVRNLQRT